MGITQQGTRPKFEMEFEPATGEGGTFIMPPWLAEKFSDFIGQTGLQPDKVVYAAVLAFVQADGETQREAIAALNRLPASGATVGS